MNRDLRLIELDYQPADKLGKLLRWGSFSIAGASAPAVPTPMVWTPDHLQVLLKEADKHRLKMFICFSTTNSMPFIRIDLHG